MSRGSCRNPQTKSAITGRAKRAAVAAGTSRDKPKPGAAPKPNTKRMTFKDRHALETLPARMGALRAEVEKFTRAMEDPDLYTRDPPRFAKTMAALDEARGKLDAAEEQWLELEISREALEG